MLTVYGIEILPYSRQCRYPSVTTIPTVYGIETELLLLLLDMLGQVATAPTVYSMRRRV